MLALRVLGELAVLREGGEVRRPQSRKTRALLGFLALEARPHRRDRLVGHLGHSRRSARSTALEPQQASRSSDDDDLRRLVDTLCTRHADQTPADLATHLSVGVALADPSSWAIGWRNARFERWFPDGLPVFDAAKAEQAIRQRGRFAFEAEVRQGPKTLCLEVEMKGLDGGILVEARDATGRRQAEHMLDSYAKLAEKHARELARTRDRAEKLLLNVMPRSVYEELREYGSIVPQRIETASVLMLDIVGFTEMALAQEPRALIAELNDVFSAFDRIAELFGCERIKTIGDGYVVVSGLSGAGEDDAANLARVALRMRRFLERRNADHPAPWSCRIGIATGPLIGALVGVQKYIYDVFGPAVNMAARLEAMSEPMRISICPETFERIREGFLVTPLGMLEIKGVGERAVFALDGEPKR